RNCSWVRGGYGEYHRDNVNTGPYSDDNWYAMALGGQVAVDDRFQLGLAFESLQVDAVQTRKGSRLSDLSAEMFQASVSASYVEGPSRLAFVAGASRGIWDSRRWVNINGYAQKYTSFDGIDVADVPQFSGKTIEFEGINGIAESSTRL